MAAFVCVARKAGAFGQLLCQEGGGLLTFDDHHPKSGCLKLKSGCLELSGTVWNCLATFSAMRGVSCSRLTTTTREVGVWNCCQIRATDRFDTAFATV